MIDIEDVQEVIRRIQVTEEIEDNVIPRDQDLQVSQNLTHNFIINRYYS